MVSIGASAFLDLPPAREGATRMQLHHNDATLTGTITGVVDAAAGLVEVSVDGSTEPPVVAASAPGLTFPGAKVKLPRDSSGRVTQVSAPIGQAPEGVEVVPVGETGVRIQETATGLVEAQEQLRQAQARMRALDEGLSEATQAVEANHAQVVARLAESSVAISAAQSRADAAASEASAARDAAVAATAKASTADGRYTVASKNPTAGDATGKPEGAVWEVRSGSTSLRRFVLQGSSWVQVKVGTDFIGENAIGATLIEPGSITTPKLAAGAVKARTVDAKDVAGAVGRFLRVTTDQIDAGAARIAGPLIADNMTGKTFTGSTFVAGSADGANAVVMGPERLDVVKNGIPHVRLDPAIQNGIAVKSPNSNALLPLASIIFGASGYTWTGTYPPDSQGYSKTTFTAAASTTGRAMFLIVSSYEVGIQSPIYRWGDIKVNGKRIYETPNQFNESGWRSGQLTMMFLGSGLPTAGTWAIETNLWMGTSAWQGFTKWSHRDISAIIIPM